METKSKFDEAKVQKLRAEHGEVFELTEGGETILARRPTRADWRKFKAARADDKKKIVALEEVFEACLLLPELDEFDRVLERKPALADTFGQLLIEIAAGEDPEGK